jgi:predicted TIM-barrel fold metal-dependent hydrolase
MGRLDWMISVDDHVLEPPNLWLERLPRRFRDEAPVLRTDDKGEAWFFDGKRVPTTGFQAAASKRFEEFTPDPVTYADMRPGCYDAAARIEDMNLDGVLASVCFPSFPRFCGQVFYEAKDHELGFECIKAWNDWMIEEWCGYAPDRLIPLSIMPLWDPLLAAREIERCAAKGARSLTFSENPPRLGLPSLYDPANYWDPVIEAASEAGVVISVHIGSSSWVPKSSDDASLLSPIIWGTASVASCTMVDWIISGKLQKFPKTKVAMSEGGIGWIPYFLERGERNIERHRYWASKRDLDLRDTGDEVLVFSDRPSIDFNLDFVRLFKDHLYGCAFADTEAFGLSVIEQVGIIDNVVIESDYPHLDSSWPNSLKVAKENLAHLSEENQYKILQGNARKLFNIDPKEPGA